MMMFLLLILYANPIPGILGIYHPCSQSINNSMLYYAVCHCQVYIEAAHDVAVVGCGSFSVVFLVRERAAWLVLAASRKQAI